MPTLTPDITHALTSRAQVAAAHLANEIINANGFASDLLALSNADLTAWLNAAPMQDRAAMFATHGQYGEGLNTIAAIVESMTGRTLPRVDVRSVSDKLAASGRALGMSADGFTVSDIPQPQPTPEPSPE